MSERLQNKIYNYEVTPPAKTWEKIAAALDESEMNHEFPSKLYEIEVTPPATTWDKIKTSLDDAEQVDSAAIESTRSKKVFPIFRYAVAAAVIGLIAFGGIQLLKNKSSDSSIASQNKKSVNKDSVIPPSTNEPNVSTDIKKDDITLEDSKQIIAKQDIQIHKKIKNASKNYFIQSSLNADESNYTGSTITSEEIKDVANRYIAVMTPDCNVVRISKKLDHLACCVAGDDQGTGCKDQMQQWQKKIARSSIAASPANFMDIVSLVSSLQDND